MNTSINPTENPIAPYSSGRYQLELAIIAGVLDEL